MDVAGGVGHNAGANPPLSSGGCAVKQVVIENPVINSPFAEPVRHFKFDDDGITDEIVEARRVEDGQGVGDPLNLILEVAGQQKKDKEAMTATALTLWVPAVNNGGLWGRWGFVEVTDPWDAERTVRGMLTQRRGASE